jgi:hypothetical protein
VGIDACTPARHISAAASRPGDSDIVHAPAAGRVAGGPTPPARAWRRLAICLLPACLPWLPACTTLTIEAGDGRVAVERHLGFVQVTPQPGTQPMVLTGTALGLQSGPLGSTLGFSRTRVTLLPDGCHVVVVLDADASLPAAPLRALLEGNPCLVTPPSE